MLIQKPAGDHSTLTSKFWHIIRNLYLENPMPRPLLFRMNKERNDGKSN